MIANKTIYLIIIILVFVFSNCSTDIELGDYIDKSTPFQLTINQIDSTTGLTTGNTIILGVNSEKWKKIIEWGEVNKEGWKSSIASYISNVYVIQGDFRLIYTSNSRGVVIGFVDNQGNGEQYTKEIVKGELDFLTILDNEELNKSDTLGYINVSNNTDIFNKECEKCNIQVIKNIYENIEKLSLKIINEFICSIDKSCNNNVEFSEWSNEMLFKIIEKNPTLYFIALKDFKSEKQQYILSEIENPVIEIDYQKIYNSIKEINVEQELKEEYLNSLKIISKKNNIEIK